MQQYKQDKRFSHIANDPRFAQMPVKRKKITIDSRFNKMLKDDKFKIKAKFNKYGQRQTTNLTQDQQLQRLYRIDEQQDKENGQFTNKPKTFQWNEVSSSSQSESDQESDLNSDQLQKMQDYAKLWNNMEQDAEILPEGGETNRFAVENLNWNMFNSTDLFKLFSSFCKPGMHIEQVLIYPTKIGKQNMENDQLYGPKGIFNKQKQSKKKKQKGNLQDKAALKDTIIKDTFQEKDQTLEKTFDINALRSYQINKMRYYFALVICDSIQTATHLVNQCNGQEMELSACFLDLRFVPDDLIQFPYEPRDQCSNLPDVYQTKSGMMNRALNHSKVELTWDQDKNDMKKGQILSKISNKKVQDLVQDDQIDDQLKDLIAISSEQEANQSDEAQQQKSYETKRKMLRDLLKTSNLKDSCFDKQYRGKGGKQIEVKFKSAFNDDKSQSENDQDEDFLVRKQNTTNTRIPQHKKKHKLQEIQQQDPMPEQKKKKLNFKEYKEKKKQIKREKKRKQKLQKFKKLGARTDQIQKKQLELLVDDGGTRRLQDFKSNVNDKRFAAMFKQTKYQIDPTKAQSQKISDSFKQRQRNILNK